jgi:predicted metal-dependent HD superfamily phosphohydrolase
MREAPPFDPGLLESSWLRCLAGVGAADEAPALFRRLMDAYREPPRKYHTLQHLSECLALFDRHRSLALEPAEVEIALWFHDAIYEVRAGDNEARSAEWAAAALRSAGVAAGRIERVCAHILATRHSALPVGQDQALLLDIDLSILGAPAARFDEYETQVRAEYRWVPDFLFRRKRREILAEFLARDPIYATPALREVLEASARENLARSLEQLV